MPPTPKRPEALGRRGPSDDETVAVGFDNLDGSAGLDELTGGDDIEPLAINTGGAGGAQGGEGDAGESDERRGISGGGIALGGSGRSGQSEAIDEPATG